MTFSIESVLTAIADKVEKDNIYPVKDRGLNLYALVLRHEYSERHKGLAKEILKKPPKFETLPFINNLIDGVNYRIYGLAHGDVQGIPGVTKLTRRMKKKIERVIDEHHNPSEKQSSFYEQGMSQIFTLDEKYEIDDLSKLLEFRRIPTAPGKGIMLGPSGSFLKERILEGLITALDLYLSTLSKANNARARPTAAKAMNSMKYQGKLGELFMELQPEEPLSLELDYVLEETSKKGALNKSYANERSLITARELLARQKELGLKSVAYFGGTKHMTSISHFLKHPEYNFERLKDFVKKA